MGELRSREDRNGDYLMVVTFQCDFCHVQNLEDRDPNVRDQRLLMFLQRTSLGSIFYIDTCIVARNLSWLQKIHRDTRGEGIISRTLPRLVLIKFSDMVGVKPEVLFLQHPLNIGRLQG